MKRVLLTGMSGTGKSTLVHELTALGYRALDMDDPGCFVYGPDGDRLWNEDRVQEFLEEESGEALFVAGCAENQGKFHSQFDHIILLSAPKEVLIERLVTRTNNPYGKDPDELADVLLYLETVEPLLRKAASHEIDTSVLLDQVVSEIMDIIRA